jgi:hypothetical protein
MGERMRRNVSIRLIAALLSVVTLTGPARADEVHHYGQLICDGNRALIRFTTAYNEDAPIFPQVPFDSDLSAIAPADSETCTLDDGREIRIKTGGRMPTAWGMCGGASNTYISLWVGMRKVLSRHWVQRACFADKDYADIIILDGDTLTLCASAETVGGLQGDKPTPGCRDASDLLRNAVHDPVEYPEDLATKPRVGTITIKLSEEVHLCRAFLHPNSPHGAISGANTLWPRHEPTMMRPPAPDREDYFAGASGSWFVFPYDEAEAIAFLPVTQFSDDPKDVRMLDPSYASVDFDNDRKKDMVFREASYSGSGVYEAFHVYSDSAALGVQDKLDAFSFDEGQAWPSLRTLAALNLPPPAVYHGTLPGLETDFPDGYTLQFAFRYDDNTYVFAAPFAREANPKAVIYRPLPGGAAEPVCIYDMVQENY